MRYRRQKYGTSRSKEESTLAAREASRKLCEDIEDSGACARKGSCQGSSQCSSEYRRAPPLHPDVLKYQSNLAPLHFVDPVNGSEWYRPVTLAQLWDVRAICAAGSKAVSLVCANTSMGVTKYFTAGEVGEHGIEGVASEASCCSARRDSDDNAPKVTIDIKDIAELQGAVVDDDRIVVGAALPIAGLIGVLEKVSGAAFPSLVRHLKRVASVQIRNVGSWAGNLMIAKKYPQFGSDIVTVFAALSIELHLASTRGQRELTMEGFLSTDLYDDEVITSCVLPRMLAPAAASTVVYKTYKIAQRHVFAHAIVNAGFLLAINKEGAVARATAVFNGVCPQILFAKATEKALTGQKINQATLQAVLAAVEGDISQAGGAGDDPRYSEGYKIGLVKSFVYKLFLEAQSSLPPALASAIVPFAAAEDRPVSSGSQGFDVNAAEAPVSEPIIKLSAKIQASGEAKYTSTLSPGTQGLYGALVFASEANVKIVSVDPTAAVAMQGVKGFVAKSDIPSAGSNKPFLLMEEVFLAAGDKAPCVGAQIGLVLADTAAHARAGAKAVKVVYSSASPGEAPPVLITSLAMAKEQNAFYAKKTIDDAIERLPFMGSRSSRIPHAWHLGRRLPEHLQPFKVGTPSDTRPPLSDLLGPVLGANGLPKLITGSFKTGAQKHFYMEPQSTAVFPQEGGALEVWSSTQDPVTACTTIAKLLGIPKTQVTVKVNRVGGGFGGKLYRGMPLGSAACVAAFKHQVPVVVVNERVDDMKMIGGREFCDMDYEAMYTEEGEILSTNMKMSMDVGSFLGDAIIDVLFASTFADNCYHTKQFFALCTPYFTHTHHTTSCRAPGALQGILMHEVVLERVAHDLGIPHRQVQEANFYKVGQKTPSGEEIGSATFNWTIPQMWAKLKKDCDLETRQGAVDAFNAANRWRKKGIAMMPVKYGIALNLFKSGSLVVIHDDGSIAVAHGGVEMGQGINTKVAQVAAFALGAPLDCVTVADADTSKIPVNGFTGASGTSECSAKSVENACDALTAKLMPYKAAGRSWKDIVEAAAADGVSLTANGWYENKEKMIPGTDNYATYGVSCSEVEVDVLTGEVQVLRTDIIMDQGVSLNPDIDIGQIEGGFIMALGYVLMEEVIFDKAGHQLTLGTWEYKVPSAYDIPIEINVQLMNNVPNPDGILKSKASAEPPMALVGSVFFAAKEAIYAARKDVGNSDYLSLQLPLTVQGIRQACLIEDRQFALS
eukprot:gene9571-11337_t